MAPEDLVAAVGCRYDIGLKYLVSLASVWAQYGIDTPARRAAFLGQTAYETRLYSQLEEDLHYSAERLVAVWPLVFGPKGHKDPAEYAMQPEKLANFIYGGRNGNGPEASGDGWAFRGGGFAMLTGRANYAAYQRDAGVQVLERPDLVRQDPFWSVDSAGWFWMSRNCSNFADAKDWVGLTHAWNGGQEGLQERIKLTERALQSLTNFG